MSICLNNISMAQSQLYYLFSKDLTLSLLRLKFETL